MLYPLKFEPILKKIIWGGDKICRFKDIQPEENGVGESWEISHVKNNVSVVSNGELKGKSLEELIETYGDNLLGNSVIECFGTNFPLLIKFIDAKEPLSIQVHPNDKLAKERHNSFGKTEMWYIVSAEKDAFLYSGFKQSLSPEEYLQSITGNTFVNYLQKYDVQAGDVFFLPAGRVHAIGSGCFIAEIQQTSDITYRIYDYNRKDAQGNTRELHTELAKDAIDYKVYPEGYQLTYNPKGVKIQNLVSCPYFKTGIIRAKKGDKLSFIHKDTFSIYICLEGKAELTDNNHYSIDIKQGETVLVPAKIQSVSFEMQTDCKLLEIFVEANTFSG
ncbi:mannose-6-phosphate isomerase [Bacteroidia bacterium]|nr:mannose-6-phosphate isomerase [Bacteroidia bacterium]